MWIHPLSAKEGFVQPYLVPDRVWTLILLFNPFVSGTRIVDSSTHCDYTMQFVLHVHSLPINRMSHIIGLVLVSRTRYTEKKLSKPIDTGTDYN